MVYPSYDYISRATYDHLTTQHGCAGPGRVGLKEDAEGLCLHIAPGTTSYYGAW